MRSCKLIALHKQAQATGRRVNRVHRLSRRCLSGIAAKDDIKPKLPNKQDFVTDRLLPGEWDDERLDPIDNPPFRSNAKIISEEDFANRPMVGHGEEFSSMSDAMTTLSWLSTKDADAIYDLYLKMMTKMAEKKEDGTGGVTSHEYVTRVIAQKFNISSARVAAVIQLAHNEDQIRKEGGVLHYELANWVDQRCQEHIQKAYEAYREEPPEGFVEDPKGVAETGGDNLPGGDERVEDIYDIDAMIEDMLLREKDEARIHIDNHTYIEDEDESLREVKVDGNSKKLLKTSAKHKSENHHERAKDFTPLPESGREEHRPRTKFVAQVIDTRKEKEKNKDKWRKTKSARKTAQRKVEGNCLVEEDGKLRVATVAEVKATSWKPTRNAKEFTYSDVKKGWIDRVVHKKQGTWGRFEETREVDVHKVSSDFGVTDMFSPPKEMVKKVETDDDVVLDSSDEEGSSSDEDGSSSDEGGSSSDEDNDKDN
mmetsp:Transcript_17762/g.24674  ORF Transcript_17762/g.24674 Transcript_17762/m.24674 type:complete len:482 (+) Transcript_17762:2-1447(+)